MWRGLFILFLVACSSEQPPLPDVKPFTLTPEIMAALYKPELGSASVEVYSQKVDGPDERELLLTVFAPSVRGDQLPLVLFSHGNWSDSRQYDAVIHHWVSHGYLVVAVDHLDCCGMANGILNSLWHGQLGLIEARVQDLKWLLDSSARIAELIPDFKGELNTDNVVAAGHSFGAYSAQQLAGAGVFDPDAGEFRYYRDARVKAVIALSPPGPMFDVITEGSWRQLDRPQLLATGTWDVNARFWPDWRSHKLAFDTAKPGNNLALITQGVDHYYGNLICRLERDAAPQSEGLLLFNSVSTAFLDAQSGNQVGAQTWLSTLNLEKLSDGFSTMERR